MRKIAIFTLLFTVLISDIAFAQKRDTRRTRTFTEETVQIGTGNWFFSEMLNFNYMWGRGENATLFSNNTELGYFVNSFIAPEARVFISTGKGSDLETFTVGARIYYNRFEHLLPYVRINVGFGTARFVNVGRGTSFVLNPGIGVDYLLTRHLAVSAAANYNRIFSNDEFNSLEFPIGFSVYF